MDTDALPLGLLEPDDPEFDDTEGDATGIADQEDGGHHPRSTVVLIVFAPKELEPKRFRFRLDETVGDAAKAAAKKFEYEVGTPSFQTKDGTVLDRSVTLRAAGVHNREELELVDAGGGV
ncbi:MAG TPA: hypothetical protein VNG12_00530 [Acidimicrobiales bacterium]|nr:hypothetical protein [Acidimicrobiales bacterium]